MSDKIEAEIIDVLGEEVDAAVDTPLVVIEGPKGDPGKDGITPTIGDNGNWYLGAEDTGKPSRGETGAQGTPGIYYGTTPPTGDTHPVWIDPDGDHDDGGLLPAVTAADNGKVLRVVSGAWGPVDMPTTLPNPNSLTFTGAVTGSYDGSAPLSVEIPSGGGGNVAVAITGMDGYKIAPTGTILVATAGTQFVSVPIPVTAGEKLRITASAKYGNSLYALYDASGAMVDNQTAAATAEGTAVEEMSVTVHADAVTLRVAWDKYVTDTAYAVIRVGGQTAPDGPLVGVKCAVIGDSVIEATAAPNAGLVELMAASTGAEITNLGVGGTGWMRGQEDGTAYYQRVADIPADTQRVLLYGSGNDRELTLGDPADTGTETVCGCVNATLDAVYAHVPTAWVGIIAPAPWQYFPPYESGNAMELLANALGAICRRRGVPYLDLYHSSGLRPWDDAFRELAYNNADGIHPNDTGYGIIAPQCSAFLVGGGTAAKLDEELPDALPNPNALTFTGAVTGSYDGSAPLSVEIPSGGGSGSDISLGLTGVSVGQIAKITSVDGTGKPTAWEAVDMSDKLPNPNALTFTGAVTGSYDGSEAKTISIPSGGGSISLPLLYDLTTSEEVGWIDTGDNAFLAKNLLFVEMTSIATTTNESDKDGSASMYPLKPNAIHAPWSNEAVAKNVSALMAKTYTKVFRAFSFRGDGGYWTSITSIRNLVNTYPVTPSMVSSQIEGVTDQPMRGLIIGNAFASSTNVFGVGSRLRVWGV